MAAPTYGVTAAGIASEMTTTFSAGTPLTSTAVATMIAEEAAIVANIALAKGFDVTGLTSDDNTYHVLASILRNNVCARAGRTLSQNPEQVSSWERAAERARKDLVEAAHLIAPVESEVDITYVVTTNPDTSIPSYRAGRGGSL